MKKFLIKRWVKTANGRGKFETILALALGALFAYAAFAKVQNPGKFLTTLYQLQVGPPVWYETLVWVIISAEIVLALLLMSGKLYVGALVLTAGSLLTFIGATLIATSQGTFTNCGCLGALSSASPTTTIVKNVIMIGVVVYCLTKTYKRNNSPQP